MENNNSFERQTDFLNSVYDTPVEYAGFWIRFAAYIIDILLIYFIAIIMSIVLGLSFNSEGVAQMPSGFSEFLLLGVYFCVLIYFPLLESSKWQATLGKRAVNIKVTDDLGQRISFGKSLGRFLAKIISAMILYIGFLMAAFTDKNQGLHDMIAGTLVIKGRGES